MTSAESHPLLVDLYELTMAVAYREEGMAELPAVFSLFVRNLPPGHGYLVAAGLDEALAALSAFGTGESALVGLESVGPFSGDQLDWLAGLRFRGDVRAVPEGTVVGAEEPLLEVAAPLAEAQLVESVLLNILTLHTSLATNAARFRHAAGDRLLVDFALRRTPGADATSALARAGRIVGLDGTSNVDGARRHGLPAVGTMAHSFVQAHPDETDAFRRFAELFGDDAVLLVDTYDTPAGVDKAIRVAIERRASGGSIRGIRLDSGDLAAHAREARRRLDDAGLDEVQIMASGGLDEDRIESLVASGAPIDGFGVGSALGDPAFTLDSVYKLAAVAGRPVHKTSEGKTTWPGPKQVWRAESGRHDHLATADEAAPGGGTHRPLLEPVMAGGERLEAGRRSLEDAAETFRRDRTGLDEAARRLAHPDPIDVRPTATLESLTAGLGDEGALRSS